MSGSLAAFQDAFVAALTGAPDSAAGEVAALVGQPGFAVYRNTLAKGCVDALRANFPAVERLVGGGMVCRRRDAVRARNAAAQWPAA